MDGEKLRAAIKVEKELLRALAKEKAKARKEAKIMERAKAAEPGQGLRVEPVFKRNKRTEKLPSGIRVIKDGTKRAEQLNKVMGGVTEKQRQAERVKLNRMVMNKMFGETGRGNSNKVPPPEFYSDAKWKAAH